MARVIGLQGRISGRLGNTVFYGGVGGQSFARQYVPNPKNPDTKRQQLSRKIFNDASLLAGKLAAAGVLKAASVGRSRLLGNLVAKKAVSFDDATATIKFDPYGVVAAIPSNDIPAPAFKTPRFDDDLKIVIPFVRSDWPSYAPYFEPESSLSVVAFAIPDEYKGGLLPAYSEVRVLTSSTAEITINAQVVSSGSRYHVFAAVREVLASKNGYPTDSDPLKYPAKITPFIYLGVGEIE